MNLFVSASGDREGGDRLNQTGVTMLFRATLIISLHLKLVYSPFFDQGMFAAELKEKLFLFSSFVSDISTQVFNEQADGSITTLVHTHEHQFVRYLFSRLCVQRLMMRS